MLIKFLTKAILMLQLNHITQEVIDGEKQSDSSSNYFKCNSNNKVFKGEQEKLCQIQKK
jgi:hypothetical protein